MKTDEYSEYSHRKYIGNLKSLKTDEYRKAYKFRLKTGEYRHVLVNGRIQIFFFRIRKIVFTVFANILYILFANKNSGDFRKKHR